MATDKLREALERPTVCELCGMDLMDCKGDTDGHGLGECVPVCPTCGGSGSAAEPPHTPTEEMREAIRECWRWFDNHDSRKTSAELHAMLGKLVGA